MNKTQLQILKYIAEHSPQKYKNLGKTIGVNLSPRTFDDYIRRLQRAGLVDPPVLRITDKGREVLQALEEQARKEQEAKDDL